MANGTEEILESRWKMWTALCLWFSPGRIDLHEGAKTARSRFNASITNSSPEAVRPVMG